jgi:thymidylate kinase
MSSPATEDVEFVIFDRYIYDELANLPLQYWIVRLYVRLVLRMVPRPDQSFLLDADPETAVSRKPEYPLEFVRRNRNAYLAIARIAGITVLPPSSVPETAEAVRTSVTGLKLGAAPLSFNGPPRFPAHSAKTPSG